MTDAKISVTLRGGQGYEEPWIVIYGDTAEEVAATLAQVRAKLATLADV